MEVVFQLDAPDNLADSDDVYLNVIIKIGGPAKIALDLWNDLDYAALVRAIETRSNYRDIATGRGASVSVSGGVLTFTAGRYWDIIKLEMPAAECVEVFRKIRDTMADFNANPVAFANKTPT